MSFPLPPRVQTVWTAWQTFTASQKPAIPDVMRPDDQKADYKEPSPQPQMTPAQFLIMFGLCCLQAQQQIDAAVKQVQLAQAKQAAAAVSEDTKHLFNTVLAQAAQTMEAVHMKEYVALCSFIETHLSDQECAASACQALAKLKQATDV